MVKKLLVSFICAFTRVVRPLFGVAGVCRYTVTCSAYARYAFAEYPFFKALYATCNRIVRCNLLSIF